VAAAGDLAGALALVAEAVARGAGGAGRFETGLATLVEVVRAGRFAAVLPLPAAVALFFDAFFETLFDAFFALFFATLFAAFVAPFFAAFFAAFFAPFFAAFLAPFVAAFFAAFFAPFVVFALFFDAFDLAIGEPHRPSIRALDPPSVAGERACLDRLS
jgi:hypothetical protein